MRSLSAGIPAVLPAATPPPHNRQKGKTTMAITTILFDLDGTLLPMDQDLFIRTYLAAMARKVAPYGYDAKTLSDTIWKCVGVMVTSVGQTSNEAVFWDVFAQVYGDKGRQDRPVFEDFYRNEFQQAQSSCGFQPLAAPLIAMLKEKGLKIVLATNPVFPHMATESRIRWAGIQPEDFTLYTTYENSRHCKPSLDYYRDILDALKLTPEECMMVGNDVEEDMIAQELGMEVFLITDCLISRNGTDLSRFRHGSFQELYDYLKDHV